MSVLNGFSDDLLLTCSRPEELTRVREYAWARHASILWENRRFLARVALLSLVTSVIISWSLPKRYKSAASIMPPNNTSSSVAMLAALAGRNMSGLAGLSGMAPGLLGAYNSSDVVVELLRSGTVADHLINRFDLQRIYHKRFRIDAAKRLAKNTTTKEDRKSGLVSITVEDSDPKRARDLTQAYLQELNSLVAQTSISSAHQERVFVEKRLATVKHSLLEAQQNLSEFSSNHATVDIKEQTRAMLDAASRLETERVGLQANLDSLRQMYSDQNVRVRDVRARINVLDSNIAKLSGSTDQTPTTVAEDADKMTTGSSPALYPPLRQLPRLAVPYSDLYRQVQIQENVFNLLTQQYELARIQEARDIPVISVIDSPGIPEKKSFPPRLLLAAVLTMLMTAAAAAFLLLRRRWLLVDSSDSRKRLIQQITSDLLRVSRRSPANVRGVA